MDPHDTIVWSMPEYEERKRSNDWFWAVGIIAIAIAVIAIIYQNILFAVFIILGAFTLLMYAARKPRMLHVELSGRGVRVNDTLYPYATLKSFSTREYRGKHSLVVESQKTLMPYLIVPLEDEEHALAAHEFLKQYLAEGEHPVTVSEALMEYLGF